MRISSFLVFLFVIIVVNSKSVLSLDDSNELMVDSSAVEKIGNDVKLVSPGIVQLVLANGALDIHIVDLEHCMGKTLFCYNSSTSGFSEQAGELCQSQSNICGFQIEAKKTKVKFTDLIEIPKNKIKSCPFIRMQELFASYCGNQGVVSCEPAFDKEKVITIDVREVSESCPITILNAKMYVPPIFATTTTSSSTSILSSSTEASTSNGSTILIVCIVVAVVVIIIIIVIAVVCYKKRANKKKRQAMNQDLEEVVIIKPVKKEAPHEVKEVAKVQPEKKEVKPPKVKEATKKFSAPHPKAAKENSKKVQDEIKPTESKPRKETTEATEEPPPPFLPAPVITESKEPIVEHEDPKKLKRQQNRWVHPFRTASGSSGSRMRGRFKDSVESQRSLNKNTAYEAHYKSMARSGLIGKKMAESLTKDYKPNPKKKLLSVEISLFCNYVGDVFVTINQLVEKAIEQLKEHDLKLDNNGKAMKLSKPTRTYLQQPDTPEYIRFTCFALEFGHSIPVDEEHLQKYSMALLLVVGFSLNHPDETRRHALAIFRRELPFWKRNSSIEERNAFGYPANAIEAASLMNSDCFNDVKHVNTNSTPNNSEEKRSNSKSNGPSKEAANTESKIVIIDKPSKKKKKRK